MNPLAERPTRMPPLRLALLAALAMLAFAANSLLCREALATGEIGAATFTLVRIVAGAAVLGLILWVRFGIRRVGGSWRAAAALFGYAAGFSYAYLSLSAATGALLLFGAVQLSMVGHGLRIGERFNRRQLVGVLAAAIGLVWFLLPGIESPPLTGALLMLGAGLCWGVYSLLGRGAGDPTIATAGNFIRAVPMALVLAVLLVAGEPASASGIGYAVASGALASGLGYAIWYAALPSLRATTAATIQLSVPILAALGGVALLGEPLSLRFALAALAVLGGIALFVLGRGAQHGAG